MESNIMPNLVCPVINITDRTQSTQSCDVYNVVGEWSVCLIGVKFPYEQTY